MALQSPFDVQNGVGPLYRKKRVYFVLATVLLTLFLLLRLSSTSSTVNIHELDGLLYMVAHTEHVLPDSLDTSAPIAPSVWIPGEPANSKLWTHRGKKLNETPLIVFSKSYCPYSRRAKDLLARYELNPAPNVVEVDLRDDSDIIKRLLIRLTNRATFPNVILRGQSLGGYDELRNLHETGVLQHELEKAGVQVMGDVHGDT